MMKKLLFVLLLFIFFAVPRCAQAATCTDTTYNNITCVQATPAVFNGNCVPDGSVYNSYATVTAGHMLIVYEGMGAPSTTVSVSGNLGTGTWTAMPNQPATEWDTNPDTMSAFYAYPTSSGTLNLTFTCSSIVNSNTESFLVELSSSVGTVGIDCSSAWTTYSSSTGPFGQSTTPLCQSTHSNDLNLSRLNNDGGLPSVCSGWTYVTEISADIDFAVEAAGAPETSVSCAWSNGDDAAQDTIVGSIALDDGGPVFVSQSGGSVSCGADGTQSTTAVSSVTWTAGTTYKLCGTITQNVVVDASGTSSALITIYFETGANITEATPGNYYNGGINLQDNSYITVNGGTPCGWDNATQSTEGTCNGVIHFTGNGNSLANQNSALGVNLGSGSNNTVENIAVEDDFVPTGGGNMDSSDGQNAACFAIFGGSNYSIHDNQCTGGTYACLYSGAGGNTENDVSFYNNYCDEQNWGIAGDTEGTSTGWLIYGNRFGDFAAWSNTSANHHDGIYIWCNPQDTGCGVLSDWDIYNNTFNGTFDVAVTSYNYIDNTQCPQGINFFNNVLAPSDAQTGGGSGYTAQFEGATSGSCSINSYNNTYVIQGTAALPCQGFGINGTNSYTVTAKNNAFQNCNEFVQVYTGTSVTGVFDYNVYADGNSSCGSTCWEYGTGGTSTPVSFSTWQTDIGGDSHATVTSSTLNLNSNYAPQSGSLAIGAATNLTSVCSGQPNPGLGALCSDAAGNARPTTGAWTAGAYNYVPTTLPALSRKGMFARLLL